MIKWIRLGDYVKCPSRTTYGKSLSVPQLIYSHSGKIYPTGGLLLFGTQTVRVCLADYLI